MISFALALEVNIANWLSIISMGVTLGLWALLIVARTSAQSIAIMIGQVVWNPVSSLPAVYPHWFPDWLY
jgi:hypothetical protein